MNNKHPLIVYPFLFSIYPVLALLAHNVGKLKFADSLRAFIFSIALAACSMLISWLVIRDWHRAGLLTALAVTLFFSYGHIYNFLEQASILGFVPGRHRVLIPVWVVILFLGYFAIRRTQLNVVLDSRTLNLIATFLMVIPGVQILYGQDSSATIQQAALQSQNVAGLTFHPPEEEPLPDVYYIVLDGYTRSDSLKEYYGFDNSEFIEALKFLGFYIASCSQSNYAQSDLSISSSLNANYIEQYYTFDENTRSKIGLGRAARQGFVVQAFEALDYTLVAFESGYFPLHLEEADIFLRFHASDLQELLDFGSLNDFEALLVRTSAGLIIADGIFKIQIRDISLGNLEKDTRHRERVIFAFDKLAELGNVRGPKFVFAHIIAPHEPYIFGPDGEALDADMSRTEGYPLQVQYVNRRTIEAIESILAASEIPPVIVIQGDHGSYLTNPAERMTIMNAYYFPNGGEQLLYPTITPVNTFRLIFNHYFGGDYDLLEDNSFHSTNQTPFQFELVPNTCQES